MNKDLSLYIHIPFCVRKCKYCDFLSMPADSETREAYVRALIMEIDSYRDTELAKRSIRTIFIGGGTPSVLDPEQIVRIIDKIKSTFNIHKCECTIEVNPGTVTKEACYAYKKAGINRVSIGLQSTCDKELELLGRIHDYAAFQATYQLLRDAGFDNINIDLMSALPGQTVDSYKQGLESVLALNPEHISAYSLIIEEGTEFYEMYGDDISDSLIEIGQTSEKNRAQLDIRAQDSLGMSDGYMDKYLPLPDEDAERKMYQITKQILQKAGYERYEISNYARPGFECKHNLVYWKRGEYLGLGLGSASFLANTRYKNEEILEKYIDLWKKRDESSFCEVQSLSKEDQMAEYMYLGLRCMDGISIEAFEEQFQISMLEIYKDPIEKYESMGFLKRYIDADTKQNMLALTDEGIDVSNHIFSEFLIC